MIHTMNDEHDNTSLHVNAVLRQPASRADMRNQILAPGQYVCVT